MEMQILGKKPLTKIERLQRINAINYWEELVHKNDKRRFISDYERLLQDHEALSYYWGPMTYRDDT